MTKYENHFLLDKESAKKYIRNQLQLFDENSSLECTEIGDGNINYVFQIIDNNGNSIVLKQADKLLRSSGRPLDIQRSKIEAEILKIQYSLSPKHVPKVFHYDENMSVLVMEDISNYKNLRKELLDAHMYDLFSEEITEFLVNTLLPTTDLCIPSDIKKKRIQLFTNIDLCAISETLVFHEPYDDYKSQNNYTKENTDFLKRKLYENQLLKGEVAKLRYNFMNNAQALIHGDLHSGSIFINCDGIKIIDPEFSFYGPMGYDMGNILGNLIFSLVYHHYTTQNLDFLNWINNQIEQYFNLLYTKLSKKYDTVVTNPLYTNDYFKKYFIQSILSDTIGYAGTEIIRRSIGDSRVTEVESIKDPILRGTIEKTLINIGESYILNRNKVNNGDDLINIIQTHLIKNREELNNDSRR